MQFSKFAEIEQYVKSHQKDELYEIACKNELLFSNIDERAMNGVSQQNFVVLLNEKTQNKYPYVASERIYEEIQDITNNIEKYRKLNSLLADEHSKCTLRNILAFRLTRDNRYLAAAFHVQGEQYFEEGIVAFPEDCVFVDCGGFDGDTTAAFICHTENFKAVYLYEPMPHYAEECRNLFESIKRVCVRDAAVSDMRGVVKLHKSATGNSRVDQDSDVVVQAVSLDEDISEQIGFLKMNIEGNEQAALAGCKRHISEDSPMMAICVYHLPADLYEIPFQISSYNNDYAFYLRHYTVCTDKTVLYAIPKSKELYPMRSGDGLSDAVSLKKYNEVLKNELKRANDSRRFLLTQYRNVQEHAQALARNVEELIEWANKLKADRDFFEAQYLNKDAQVAELIVWADKLTEARDFFETQYQQKDAQVAELIAWADKLTEARDFFEAQSQQKDAQIAELIEWAGKLTEAKDFFEMQYQQKDAQVVELIEWANKLAESHKSIEEQSQKKDSQIQALTNEKQELENTIAKQQYKLKMLLSDARIQRVIAKKRYEI